MKNSAGRKPRRPGLILAGVPLAAACLIVFALYGDELSERASAQDSPQAAQSASSGEGAATREAALTVTVTRVAPVELERTIAVNGEIHAWQEVIIGPEVGGYRVAEVHVDVGDEVEKGEELVELSSALLDAEVELKRAAVAQAEAALANAEASLRRARELAARDIVAAAELDRLESEALVAEARVASARADLHASELRLEFTHVLAPDDGVITTRNVTVGQIAQVGEEMLRLLRQGRIEWRGDVPEARLARLAPGQSVMVTTAGGAQLEGTIRIVSPTVTNANHTGTVYVDLETAKHARPGMFARGEIMIGREHALTVPLESVVTSDGYSYVFVVGDDDTVERRRVQVGAVHGSAIEVIEGLTAGERVAVEGAGFLKDGDLVNVVNVVNVA